MATLGFRPVVECRLVRRAHVALLLLTWPAAAQSASVQLSGRLEEWKREIEQHAGAEIIVARVYTDASSERMILSQDAERPEILAGFLAEETFRAQLSRAHALMASREEGSRAQYYVLLNMALADQWEGSEEAVIAHEFGHAWLDVLGYASPSYEPGPRSCVAVHAGDIVQHILIREEMERRGIPYIDYWLRNLKGALERLETRREEEADRAPPCQQLALVALRLDASLGLTTETWDDLPRFLAALDRNFPDLKRYAADLESRLRTADVRLPEAHASAVAYTLARLQELYEAANGP